MINLECLCSTVDIAPEVNGFPEECWRAENKLRVYFPSGFSLGLCPDSPFTPASPSLHQSLHQSLHHPQGGRAGVGHCHLSPSSSGFFTLQHCQGSAKAQTFPPIPHCTEITNTSLGQADRAVIQGGDLIFFSLSVSGKANAIVCCDTTPQQHPEGLNQLNPLSLCFEISKKENNWDYIDVMLRKHCPVCRISLKFNLC